MKKLAFIIIGGLLTILFYYNLSNFYNLLFTLDPENYDILPYLFSSSDLLLSLFGISLLASLKLNFINHLIQKISSSVIKFQELLICLDKLIRSPPFKNF